MNDKSIRRVRAGVITTDAVAVVYVGAPEFVTHAFFLITIPDHLQSCLAHRNAILSNGVDLLILEVNAAAFVQVNDCRDGIFLANRHAEFPSVRAHRLTNQG